MDGAQGRKGGNLLCMDERKTTGKNITQQENVTKDIRDLISHSKKEVDRGESSKGQIESQNGLHLGLKEQKNKFRNQEGAREEATRSSREKMKNKLDRGRKRNLLKPQPNQLNGQKWES